MEAKKLISPEAIKTAILEQALVLKRKKELHEEVLKIEGELKTLNESVGMIGSFGFASPSDVSNKTKTGFVNNFQNISHIARLENEMASAPTANLAEEQLNELTKLKEEVEKLQKENAELKAGKTENTIK
jgi:hypothetical protein